MLKKYKVTFRVNSGKTYEGYEPWVEDRQLAGDDYIEAQSSEEAIALAKYYYAENFDYGARTEQGETGEEINNYDMKVIGDIDEIDSHLLFYKNGKVDYCYDRFEAEEVDDTI